MSQPSVSETSDVTPWVDSEPAHQRDPRSAGSLFRALIMPLVLAAFATYLLIGMLTMEVPESAAFPGPRFFPAIIAGVIYFLVALETIGVFRRWSSGTLPTTDPDGAPSHFSWSSLA